MASKAGSSQPIVGYRYFMSVHMGISRGPVNELVEIRVGDLKAWNGAEDGVVTDNTQVYIDKPDLFGGEEKEGGIKGNLDVLMGAAAQIVPQAIKDIIGGLIPDFRGVATLFYDGLIAVNNPYPKTWKMRVRRTTAGWDNDAPWNPDKALIQIDDLPIATLTFTDNPVPGDFVLIGGVSVHFNTAPVSGIDVIIGSDREDTASRFIDAVNLYSSSLFNVTAAGSGDLVELTATSGSMPSLSQTGSITINTAGGDVHAMNAAHIIYECATNKAWGRGLPAAVLDETSFLAAADALYGEGFGLCLRWNREDDIDKFVQSVINHIGGVLFIDRSTGLLTFNLIRNDYSINDTPLFGFDSGLIDIVEDQVSSTDATYNEIIVNYHDPTIDQDKQVRVQDLASIQSIGSVISTTADYPGLPTSVLALRVAQRDVQTQSVRRMVVKLDRAGWVVKPGGVFRVTAPSRGISEIVLRAGRIEDGPLTDGTITITAIQDVFNLPATSYIGTQQSTWVPPDKTARVVDVRRIEEMTYRDIAGLNTADLAAVEPDAGAIKVLAKRPSGLAMDYVIDTAADSEDFVERGVSSWEPTALLTAAIDHYDTAITFNTQSDTTYVTGGPVLIDDEYVRLDAIDLVAGTATIARGVEDTIPAPHAFGTRLWFEDARQGGDGREYVTGETVHVKLLTRTSSQKLAAADAPTDDILIGGRQGRPYPPGALTVNGTPFGDVVAEDGDLVLVWAHRDRLSQGDFLLEHGAGSTGPEAGTTYTIRVYDGASLLRTVVGLTGTTWTYDGTMSTADGSISPLTLELESVRGGLVSWQMYNFTLGHNPSGFNDGFDDDFDGPP